MRLPSTTILGTAEILATEPPVICRDTAAARWWARPLSRHLAGREAKALTQLRGLAGFPALLHWDGRRLTRSLIHGHTLCGARPDNPGYFRQALGLLIRMHRRGVAHNDLAREPNWLVTPDNAPALIDFQLAWCDQRRGWLFRQMAREDLRHLLKHKRQYCPERLTARQKRLLAAPGGFSRAWRWTLHPLGRRLRSWLAAGT